MAKNQVRIGVGVQDNATKPIKGIRDAFHRLQTQGGKGFAIGAGAAITAKGFDLLGSAASGVVGVLGDAVKAAMADEESVNRLSASLKANVPAWNGNTDAIEANILAKQRLGFDDETLRNSLTVLAGATHDVTKAQEIQNTAMDLARFKGIDLKTASEALIKVEGGQYRSLKQLGIKLKDGATATEALAAVQAVATGQAEAYAKTLSGKVVAAQIKVGEQLENLGTKLMPLVADGLTSANDLFDNTGKEVDQIGRALEWLRLVLEGDGDALADFNAHGEESRQAMRHMADAAKDDLIPTLTDAEQASKDLADAEADAEQASKDFEQAIKDAGTAAEQSKRKFDKTTDQIDLLADALFGGAQKTGELAQAKKDLNVLLKEGPETKSAADIDIWKGKVAEAREALFLLQLAMARADGPAALQTFLLGVIKKTGEADVAVRALAQSILNTNAAYIALAAMADAAKDDVFVPTPPTPPTPPVSAGGHAPPSSGTIGMPFRVVPASVPRPITRIPEFAEGGTVPGPVGQPQLAVVHGGEEVIPRGESRPATQFKDPTGRLWPSKQAYMQAHARGLDLLSNSGDPRVRPGAQRASEGMTLNLTVNLTGQVTPGSARQFADEVGPVLAAWMQRNGLIPRRGSPLRG